MNSVWYGDPGVGKTVLAGSASEVAEMAPVIFVDIEGGTLSLRERYPLVDVVRINNWNDMQQVYAELRQMTHGYKTVVLDSLTEIQKFSMNQIMREVIQKDSDRDPDVPSIREWGKNGEQTRRLVRLFRDLPMNTIFTALAKYDRDPKTGTVHTKPSLSGKLADEVAGFLDTVGYMYTKIVEGEVQRLMLTSKTETQIAKDRSGKLPTVVIEPTMAKIHAIMFNNEEATE